MNIMSKKQYYVGCVAYINGIRSYLIQYCKSGLEAEIIKKKVRKLNEGKNEIICPDVYADSVFQSEINKFSWTQLHGKHWKKVDDIVELIEGGF